MNNFLKTTLLFLALLTNLVINAQDLGKLYLNANHLRGDCNNKYFTGFEIELDSSYTEIDTLSLFKQFPRIGSLEFKNKVNIPTEFTLSDRAGFRQIMFRFKSDYLTFDHLTINDHSITFTVDHDPEVPATEQDLKIIRLTKQLLASEASWNKEDDRVCSDDLSTQRYSLYCAIRIASLEIEEKYNHRNATLQRIRHLIKKKYPDKVWKHRLMDFNNDDDIDYMTIIHILDEIEQDFILQTSKTK